MPEAGAVHHINREHGSNCEDLGRTHIHGNHMPVDKPPIIRNSDTVSLICEPRAILAILSY
jgi:hypothetical protein